MRDILSGLIAKSAAEDSRYIVLSGDHGYALFDKIRREKPRQFLNVGVAEQAMVGLAAGLSRAGFKPVVYGLSSFIPMRVLEQIKIDVCFSKLPILFLGDGAGLVYSTLGASHQCGEDIACLRPLPHMRIYSPCDGEELRACYVDALRHGGPSYMRIGKSDRPAVHPKPLASVHAHFIRRNARSKICLVSTGSMVSPCADISKELSLSCLSVPQIKPLPKNISKLLSPFRTLVIVEEHSRHGGLASAVLERLSLDSHASRIPKIHSLALEDKFSKLCGSYQYALSEHGLADAQLLSRIKKIARVAG